MTSLSFSRLFCPDKHHAHRTITGFCCGSILEQIGFSCNVKSHKCRKQYCAFYLFSFLNHRNCTGCRLHPYRLHPQKRPLALLCKLPPFLFCCSLQTVVISYVSLQHSKRWRHRQFGQPEQCGFYIHTAKCWLFYGNTASQKPKPAARCSVFLCHKCRL